MKMWIQIRDHDEDDEYSDAATYEILTGGVLEVTSGNDIHLYSPAHWQEVMIDTRPRFSVTNKPNNSTKISNGNNHRFRPSRALFDLRRVVGPRFEPTHGTSGKLNPECISSWAGPLGRPRVVCFGLSAGRFRPGATLATPAVWRCQPSWA